MPARHISFGNRRQRAPRSAGNELPSWLGGTGRGHIVQDWPWWSLCLLSRVADADGRRCTWIYGTRNETAPSRAALAAVRVLPLLTTLGQWSSRDLIPG